jgi:hypothetical protein
MIQVTENFIRLLIKKYKILILSIRKTALKYHKRTSFECAVQCGIRIRIRIDLHYFVNLDPDPDPHQLKIRIRIRIKPRDPQYRFTVYQLFKIIIEKSFNYPLGRIWIRIK